MALNHCLNSQGTQTWIYPWALSPTFDSDGVHYWVTHPVYTGDACLYSRNRLQLHRHG